MKNNILIFGDGLLGNEIFKQTGWDLKSRKKDGIDIRKPETFEFDLYDTIINCVANTNTYSDNKEEHWNTNYVGVSNLVDYCNINNKKLIHISTDYVYTNSISNASENDIPIHGNNWYSYTKLLADAYIELKSNNYLICRTSHKPYPFPYENAWVNLIGNFDYVDVIASLIIKLINKKCFGIYNVGTELKSIFSLAKKTNQYVNAILKPYNTPLDVSINLTKINSLKYD